MRVSTPSSGTTSCVPPHPLRWALFGIFSKGVWWSCTYVCASWNIISHIMYLVFRFGKVLNGVLWRDVGHFNRNYFHFPTITFNFEVLILSLFFHSLSCINGVPFLLLFSFVLLLLFALFCLVAWKCSCEEIAPLDGAPKLWSNFSHLHPLQCVLF